MLDPGLDAHMPHAQCLGAPHGDPPNTTGSLGPQGTQARLSTSSPAPSTSEPVQRELQQGWVEGLASYAACDGRRSILEKGTFNVGFAVSVGVGGLRKRDTYKGMLPKADVILSCEEEARWVPGGVSGALRGLLH